MFSFLQTDELAMDAQTKTYILIVDDSHQNLITLDACLQELDQHLIFANSAREALRYVLQYDFAVILMDVHMPIMDGFETARLIRSRDKSSYTPIIFVSALNKDEADINQGYAMGAVDYIFKPINPVILRSKVKVFVDLFTKSSLAVNLQNELKKRELAEKHARKQQQQLELAKVDRVSSMEEMTSALAHEINQPLATITNYVQGCIRRIQDGNCQGEQLLSALQRAGEQAERAGAIIHRIKNFVRKNKLYRETVDINELVISVTSLLQDSIDEAKVKISLTLSDTAPKNISLDKVQIEQVIINLLRNSVEALQHCSQSDRQLIIETQNNQNKNLIINIKDNGPGINPEHLDRLFDLYFTTKPQGMGIGLSICRTIIEAHGGNVIAKNNSNGGASFQISLPIQYSKDYEHEKLY